MALPSPEPSPSQAPAIEPSPSATPMAHVSLPPNWQQVEMTEAALSAQVKALTTSNPPMAQMLQQVLTSGQFRTMQFYAFDYDGLKLVGNVNVLALAAGELPLDAIVPAIEGQFKQIGATDVTSSHATLLGVDAVVIDYHLTLDATSSGPPMSGRAYLVPVGGTIYDMTITCYESDATSCMSDGDAMAKGMTVGP